MKIMSAKFIKSARLSRVYVSFRVTHIVFPTFEKTKAKAMPEIKRQLHAMVDAL